jgi:putative drug exporter of the RND superfamily
VIRWFARYSARWWWAVVGFWVIATIGLTIVAPPFEQVATFDEAAFLPADSDTVMGGNLLEEGWPDDQFTRVASLAAVRDDGTLGESDLEWVRDTIEWMESDDAPDALGDVTTHLDEPDLEGALLAENEQAMIVILGMDVPGFTPRANEAIETVRDHIREVDPPPEGLDAYVTGAVASAADESRAIDASLARAQILSVFLVITILLYVFRSPVAPLVPFTMIGVSYLVSLAIVSLLAQAGMDVSSLYETFSLVIIFGAGTDYGLLIISRYREELSLAEERGFVRNAQLRRRTVIATVAVLGAVIASSAGTIMVGFTSMSVAEFGMYRTMGPAMALAIAITLFAGLTLIPAMMKMFGRYLLWPQSDPRGVRGSDELLVLERADELGFDEELETVDGEAGRAGDTDHEQADAR